MVAATPAPANVPNSNYKLLNAGKQIYYGVNNQGLYKKVGGEYYPVTWRKGQNYEWNKKKQRTPISARLNFGSKLTAAGPSIYIQYPELKQIQTKLTQVKMGTMSTGAAQNAILRATMRPRTLRDPMPPYFNKFPHWKTLKNDPRLSAKQKETVRKILASLAANVKFEGNRPAINFNINSLNNAQIKSRLQAIVNKLQKEKEERERAANRNRNRNRGGSAPASAPAAAPASQNISHLYW